MLLNGDRPDVARVVGGFSVRATKRGSSEAARELGRGKWETLPQLPHGFDSYFQSLAASPLPPPLGQKKSPATQARPTDLKKRLDRASIV